MHKLQSVSANFRNSSSELYSEFETWAGKCGIAFRSSQAVWELRFEIRKFILRLSEKLVREKSTADDNEKVTNKIIKSFCNISGSD